METHNPSLATEIVQMVEVDQAMRTQVMHGEATWDSSVDEANQSRLMAIVDALGWPTISQVGSEASRAAWQLIQHAPSLIFMERCLALMETLPPDEVNPRNVAYLRDRVLMMNGRPQIYGTQFKGRGKDMHVHPIEDVENIEQRRAAVGLAPFAEDEAHLRQMYGTED